MKKGRDNEYIASVVFVYTVYGFWGQSWFTNSDSRLSFPRISQLCACFIVMFDQQLVICYTYTGRQKVHAFSKWVHQVEIKLIVSSWLILNKTSSSNEVLSFVLRCSSQRRQKPWLWWCSNMYSWKWWWGKIAWKLDVVEIWTTRSYNFTWHH